MEKMRIGSRENEQDQVEDKKMQCGCDVGTVCQRSRKSVENGSSKIPFRLDHHQDHSTMNMNKLKDGFHLRTDKLFLHYLVCFSLALLILLPASVSAKLYTNEFAVHVPAGRGRADEIATEHGFTNRGQVSIYY